MDDKLKIIIREVEEVTFSFFAHACMIQYKGGRDYLYEQPQKSALLKTATACELAEKTHSTDQYTCMCMHDLKSPVTGIAHMKPTVLRGTIKLTPRTLKWCDGSHPHELLNGKLPGGVLRTQAAQDYTSTFCKRACRDCKSYVANKSKAYPVGEDEEDDEKAEEDPYQIGDKIEEKRTPLPIPVPTTPPPEFMRPTAKRLPAPQTPQEQPQAPQAQASSSSSSSGATNQPKDASETERLSKAVRDLSEQWDRELAEGIQAGEKAADELKQLETTESAQPKRKKVVFQDQNQPGTDLIPAEPPTDVPADLEPEKNKPVCETMVPSLDEIKKLYGQRISKGVTASIQTGPRLRMLQELFGDPSGIRIHLAVVAKRPKASEAPEPLLSREYAPMLQELILHKDKSKWMKTPWKKVLNDTLLAATTLGYLSLWFQESCR
jgi:hypothetical protein